jgi:hypothetical protein
VSKDVIQSDPFTTINFWTSREPTTDEGMPNLWVPLGFSLQSLLAAAAALCELAEVSQLVKRSHDSLSERGI